MTLSVRVFLVYFIIVAVAAWYGLDIFRREIDPGVRKAMESSLVDMANLLAELAAEELEDGRLSTGTFAQAVRRYEERTVDARVYDITKRSLDYRVYVTDTQGTVIYDSAGGAVGEDYSAWNNVYLTLRGEYGARSSRRIAGDPTSSEMHVAAPIRIDERMLGVLTVAYPTALLQPIVERSQTKVRNAGLALLSLALGLGLIVTWGLTRGFNRLEHYARDVARGVATTAPNFHSREMVTLTYALESMREELEGKQYVERYVQSLAHEMKSPLAAIRGAAELLEEDLPAADRKRFLTNVREQSARLEDVIVRMLELASLEHRRGLENPTKIDIFALATEVLARHVARLGSRSVAIQTRATGMTEVMGERFLLSQAISNVVDNAIDFTPQEGSISVVCEGDDNRVRLTVHDTGPGIPEFAETRIFERFYSLPRPDTGRKGTGLGLPFVRQVAELHGGEASVANSSDGGAIATLVLPAA